MNLPKEYVDRLREKAKNGTLTEDEQMLLVEIIAGEPEAPVKGKPKAEPVRERKVVTVPAEVHAVTTELTNDDISRLRMRAKRNELTDDERMIYAEYLRQQQAEGKWSPGEDAYKHRNQYKEPFNWRGVFGKVGKAVIALVVLGSILYFGIPAFASFMDGRSDAASDAPQTEQVAPEQGGSEQVGSEDGGWNPSEFWEGIFDYNGGKQTIEDLGNGSSNDSGKQPIEDLGGNSGGKQTIEDLGNGAILINE